MLHREPERVAALHCSGSLEKRRGMVGAEPRRRCTEPSCAIANALQALTSSGAGSTLSPAAGDAGPTLGWTPEPAIGRSAGET